MTLYLLPDTSDAMSRLTDVRATHDDPMNRVPHRAVFTLRSGDVIEADPCTFSATGLDLLTQAMSGDGEPLIYIRDGIPCVLHGREVTHVQFLPEDIP